MTKIEKVLYVGKTRTSAGGRDGTPRGSDSRLDIMLSSPGSAGNGSNPEQLFAAGDAYFNPARLNVSVQGLTQGVAQTLVDSAHKTCRYSKATRDNIDVVIDLV